MPIHDLLNRLEEAENSFSGSLFLAPVLDGRQVSVRIAGVACRLRVSSGLPDGFRGWAVLRAETTSRAVFVRPASLSERAAYLALFPGVQLIVLEAEGKACFAWPARRGDKRFRIQGVVPVLLPEEGLERFETILARFDGTHFWFDRRDPTRDPALAAYLREQIASRDPRDGLPPPPERLHKRGLSAEEREAYALLREVIKVSSMSQIETRLSFALEHAGASLLSFTKREGAYVVDYVVDGRPHTSLVDARDLTVLTAGICLSGEDQRFDLTSLVGVLRESSLDE